MLISVIIPIHSAKRVPILLKAIGAHQNQTYKKKEIIIVVDNNPRVYKFLNRQNYKDISVIHNIGERGLSNARNLGIRAVKGEIIAFIDDDAIPHHNWLEEIVEKYSIKGIYAVGGIIQPNWNNNEIKWLPKELYWIIGCTYTGFPLKKDFRVRNLIGCNMSYRKTVFDEIGLFKGNLGRVGKSLLGGEETEYCIRVLNHFGAKSIFFNPEALVWHVIDSSRKDIIFLIKRSFFEGITKGVMKYHYNRSFSNKERQEIPETEANYLIFLLTKAIPERIKRIFSPLQFLQLTSLILSIALVGVGYIIGRVIIPKKRD